MAERFALPPTPGTYALILTCDGSDSLAIGRLGDIRLRPGYYVYIGSACGPGGLRARIGHHQRTAGRPRWHIDYLRARAPISAAWYCCGRRCEHEWAARIAAMPGAASALPGFGSSDCACETHLYWFEVCPSAVEVRRALGAEALEHPGVGERQEKRP